MTDIARYLDFVLKILFAFGLAFEVPVATILLVWAGITTPKALASKRPYVIVGAFVLGMLLTPPDAISQTLLAVPVWLLFELGLVLSRFFVRQREETDTGAAEDEWHPLSEEEMDAELDRAEADEAGEEPSGDRPEDEPPRRDD